QHGECGVLFLGVARPPVRRGAGGGRAGGWAPAGRGTLPDGGACGRGSRGWGPARRGTTLNHGGAGNRPLHLDHRSALVEAAREALLAPFFVDERRLAALRPASADLRAARVGGRRGLWRRLQIADVLGQGARERVREREDLVGTEARGLATADARELADDLFEPALSRERRRQPENERNQSPERFRHRHRVRAALTDLYEDLEGLVLVVLGDRDPRRPDRRLGPVGRALEASGARLDDRLARRRGDGRALVLLGRDADVQDLLALASVAEHRDAQAAQLPGQTVGARHVFFGGVVRQIDGLRDAVVGRALERGLVPH